MINVLEIEDKTGRKICLPKERWTHIMAEHPELSNKLENIKETIRSPLSIKQSKHDDSVKYFYKYYKNRNSVGKYLLVAVKYLNGKGFIITSFYTKDLRI